MKNEYDRARAKISEHELKKIDTQNSRKVNEVKHASLHEFSERKILKRLPEIESSIISIFEEVNRELCDNKGAISHWAHFSETEEFGVSGFEEYETISGYKSTLDISYPKSNSHVGSVSAFICNNGSVKLRMQLFGDFKYHSHRHSESDSEEIFSQDLYESDKELFENTIRKTIINGLLKLKGVKD